MELAPQRVDLGTRLSDHDAGTGGVYVHRHLVLVLADRDRRQSGVAQLAFDVLADGMSAASVRTLLVNEPILISTGRNSDIRYNFFYPRWAYDEYRQMLSDRSTAYKWIYLDLWDLVPAQEFTNSAIHLTPKGEAVLTNKIVDAVQTTCK